MSGFGIVDLFAGPGGLSEGFTSLVPKRGRAPFAIGISVEKEKSAHRTLTLRAFLRAYQAKHRRLPPEFIRFHAGEVPEPEWEEVDAAAWAKARHEARKLELGTDEAKSVVDRAIDDIRKRYDETVLIGGPPCQAYSLVGRARSRGNAGYVPEDDHRHYLFREYLRVLGKLKPGLFVMENVKGMLSSSVKNRLIFDMLMEDLASLGKKKGHEYELRAIHVEGGKASLKEAKQPADFLVRTEELGLPQRRHRVIIVGIRSDIARGARPVSVPINTVQHSVHDAIGTLAPLRSGLSRCEDTASNWQGHVARLAREIEEMLAPSDDAPLIEALSNFHTDFGRTAPSDRKSTTLPDGYGDGKRGDLLAWLEKPELRAIAQHETRGHMVSDLGRYLYASLFAQTYGVSPKAIDFPLGLSPAHRNWSTGAFNDRFRVQMRDVAATTITSHISKDGHYFIHPDPVQCRSLTVREAARLQTFPDDYYFLGNRTQQYVQIGNAVPPLLAQTIARLVLKTLRPRKSVRSDYQLNLELLAQ